jgi:hypothetical protein
VTDEPTKPPTPARHPLAGALAITLGILLLAFTLFTADRSRLLPGVHLATLSVKKDAKLVRSAVSRQTVARQSDARVTAQRLDLLDRSISDLEAQEDRLATNRLGYPFTGLTLTSAFLLILGGRLCRGPGY